jgi:hypothetical protein
VVDSKFKKKALSLYTAYDYDCSNLGSCSVHNPIRSIERFD